MSNGAVRRSLAPTHFVSFLLFVAMGMPTGFAQKGPPPPTLDPHPSHTKDTTLTMSGDAPGSVEVEVSGPLGIFLVPVASDRFSAEVPLGTDRVNHLFFTGLDSGGTRGAPTPTSVTHDTQPPSLFVDTPEDGSDVFSRHVDVAGRVGDLLSGFMGLRVTVNGKPAVVDIGVGNNGTFVASQVPITPLEPTRPRAFGDVPQGERVIRVVARDALGNRREVSVEVQPVDIPDDAPTIEITSGNGQSAPTGSPLPDPIVVRLLRGDGTPFVGKVVTFKIARSDGTLEDGVSSPDTMLQVRTDAEGLAQAFWTLGTDAGCGNNRVTVESNGIFGDGTFCASAIPGPPTQISVGTGHNQRAETGGPAPAPLVAWVNDEQNGAPDVPVIFNVVQGDGLVNGQTTAVVLSDATGHAATNFTLGSKPGDNIVEATFTGNTQEPIRFVVRGIERDESQPTRFSGVVLNNAQQPVQGAEVVLHIGNVDTPPVYSDLSGQFFIDNIPSAGQAHLSVDGTTAFHVGGGDGQDVPPGTYPFLEYVALVVPNANNALPTPVLLPRLNPDNERLYDTTTDVELTIPGMEGLIMRVRAGTEVTLPDGSKASPLNPVALSLNQVHFDEIPMPIPDGAAPPFAWTLQPGGAQFDPPVEIEMPNMVGLPPLSITYFISFDHDTESFNIVATGAVTEDGQKVVTDPGSGISKSGWGGFCPPYPNIASVIAQAIQDLIDNLDNPDEEAPSKHRPLASPFKKPKNKCAKKKSRSGIDPVYLFSGEYYEVFEDLRIPGRGLDFVWSRKYRSKQGPNSSQGNGWDFSYNVFVEAAGDDRIVCDGNSREDRFRLRKDGTWSKDGFFQILEENPDGTLTMTFQDSSTWDFFALDGAVQQGKLSTITDRNGNQLTMTYDGAGRLVTVTDTLDRDIAIVYNADGFIESVTDFAGRQVRYTYYQNGDAGGGFGDLESVTCPTVIGTPHGNDFPLGKTTVFTYSTGFADERLNHNLLTITDPLGQTFLQNTYSPTTNPNALEFDRIVSQVWGDAGDIVDVTYVAQVPSEENNEAVIKTILNDRNGNVKEYFYNDFNLGVLEREFTGRADPDLPTTETNNRPSGKLRPDDPDFFETRYEYNADRLLTRIVYPNGNEELFLHGFDLDRKIGRRARGNSCVHIRTPGAHSPSGDQNVIVETFDYDKKFNFVTRHVDGRGNIIRYTYDGNGNHIRSRHRIGSIVEDYEYNEFGQVISHTLPDNGSGHRRRDEFTYYEAGPQRGYRHLEIEDATVLALTTSYEYDVVGNITRTVDPRGNDTLYVVNELNQVVRESSREVTPGGVRYDKELFYDANDNLVRLDVANIDGDGVLDGSNPFITKIFEYDTLNYLVRDCEESGSFDVPRTPPQLDCQGLPPSEFITRELVYDANRNEILTRYGEAVEGRQPTNVLQTLYDERDLVFRSTRAPGDPDQSTTQFDYDGNQNLLRVRDGIEDVPRVTLNTHDGYDRVVSTILPMGNEMVYEYDANDNIVKAQSLGELVDVEGASGNIVLWESEYEYDKKDRKVREERSFFDAETGQPFEGGQQTGESITTWDYSDLSEVVAIVNDNGHQTQFFYDTANRMSTTIDAKGNQVDRLYDGNDNIVETTETDRSDTGPDEVFVETVVYDGLDRKISTTDNVGNTTTWSFDARGNLITTVDALGNETRFEYDSANRQTRRTIVLTDDGTGGGTPQGAIVTQQIFDDSDRILQRFDDEGNSTTYTYDALDRSVTMVHEDGTVHTRSYDVHHNLVETLDANGTLVTYNYDLADRLTQKGIQPGPGVSVDTTFETFEYDGLDRIVHAEDNDTVVLRAYDSLSNVIRETQNGLEASSTWNGLSNPVQWVYPGGRVVDIAYDELERVQTISDNSGTIANFQFVGVRRVAQRDLGNGTRTLYGYDGATGVPNPPGDFGVRRMITSTHIADPDGAATVIDDRAYTWDPVYNKKSRVDLRAGGPQLEHNYTYDSAYRLERTIVSDSQNPSLRDEGYGLDGAGNRLDVTGGPRPGNYTLDDSLPDPGDGQVNQYTSTSFDQRTYDANGNLTAIDLGTASERLYTYDYRNRMVEATDAATGRRHVYRYDAFGRRVERIVDADGTPETTRYLYDGWRVCEERDQTSAVRATYVYGRYVDEVLQMQRDGVDFYYHGDDLYNVTAVTNSTGVVVERYEYEDFGEPSVFDGAGQALAESAIGNSYLFNGRRLDNETGFYLYRTRYLDPRSGRFTTRDTIGMWGDPNNLGNGYAYVGNNPWTFLDPYGESITDFVAGLLVGIGKGAWSFVKGIGSLAYNLATKPVKTATELIKGMLKLQGLVLTFQFAEAFKMMHPELYELVTKWKCLSDRQRGELLGKMIGKYGAAALTGIGLAKLIDKVAKVASRLAKAGGTKIANAVKKVLPKKKLSSMGRPGKGRGVREVVGGAKDARKLFDRLRGNNPVREVKPGVHIAKGPNGKTLTFRAKSKSGPPTVDVHGIEPGLRKIKFVDN